MQVTSGFELTSGLLGDVKHKSIFLDCTSSEQPMRSKQTVSCPHAVNSYPQIQSGTFRLRIVGHVPSYFELSYQQ